MESLVFFTPLCLELEFKNVQYISIRSIPTKLPPNAKIADRFGVNSFRMNLGRNKSLRLRSALGSSYIIFKLGKLSWHIYNEHSAFTYNIVNRILTRPTTLQNNYETPTGKLTASLKISSLDMIWGRFPLSPSRVIE
jgi:hypothetical protein